MPRRHALLVLPLVLGLCAALVAGAAFKPPPTTEEAEGTRTHFHFLLDRSGSMAHLQGDVVGGFNAYVMDQARESREHPEDTRLLSLVQFDTQDPHAVHFDAMPVTDVPPITEADFIPRGGTPLYDAIGLIIARAESVRQPGKGERSVVIIFTDGEENSSEEHTQGTVAELIERKKAEGWTFVFLGANQDAYGESSRVGFARGSTQNYMADSGGVRAAFDTLSAASNSYVAKERVAKQTSKRMHAAPAAAAAYVEAAMPDASEDFFGGFDGAQQDFERRSQQQPTTGRTL